MASMQQWKRLAFGVALAALGLTAAAKADDYTSLPRKETLIVENPEGTIKNPGWFNIWVNAGAGVSTGLQQLTMDPLVEIENLKAYYRAFLFGVDREVRAVDDISLTIGRGEVYGVAGESSSGKTTLIKTIAGAIRPPLRVVSGNVKFHFAGGTQDIYAMKPEERMTLADKASSSGTGL